jgi:hypothetical protein
MLRLMLRRHVVELRRAVRRRKEAAHFTLAPKGAVRAAAASSSRLITYDNGLAVPHIPDDTRETAALPLARVERARVERRRAAAALGTFGRGGATW